jgi:hypothetical protein
MESYPLASGSRLLGLVKARRPRELSPETSIPLEQSSISGAEAELLSQLGEMRSPRGQRSSASYTRAYATRPRGF